MKAFPGIAVRMFLVVIIALGAGLLIDNAQSMEERLKTRFFKESALGDTLGFAPIGEAVCSARSADGDVVADMDSLGVVTVSRKAGDTTKTARIDPERLIGLVGIIDRPCVGVSPDGAFVIEYDNDNLGAYATRTGRASTWNLAELPGWTNPAGITRSSVYPLWSDDSSRLALNCVDFSESIVFLFARYGDALVFKGRLSLDSALDYSEFSPDGSFLLARHDDSWRLYATDDLRKSGIPENPREIPELAGDEIGAFSGDGSSVYFLGGTDLIVHDVATGTTTRRALDSSDLEYDLYYGFTGSTFVMPFRDDTLLAVDYSGASLDFIDLAKARVADRYYLADDPAVAGDEELELWSDELFIYSAALAPVGPVLDLEIGREFSDLEWSASLDLDKARAASSSGFRRWTDSLKPYVWAALGAIWLLFELLLLPIRASRAKAAAIASDKRFSGLSPNAARLFLAVERGDAAAVKALVRGRGGASLAAQRSDAGMTPLVQAAFLSRADCLAPMLAAGADPNGGDAEGHSPILAACSAQDPSVAVVSLLLGAGADPRLADVKGTRPAELCAERGLLDCLRAIGDDDPGALGLADRDGRAPAYAAAELGRADCLAYLAEKSPESLRSRRSSDSASPAYAAAFAGRADLLELIAARDPGALSLPGPNGYLPATICALKGHEAAAAVIARFAPGDFAHRVRSERNVTAAILSAQEGHPGTLKVAIRAAPESLSATTDKELATAAHAAAFKGHAECLEALGEADAALLAARDAGGGTPAFMAAQEGHVDCLRVVARLAPATLVDEPLKSPVLIAIQAKRPKVLAFYASRVPEAWAAAYESFDKGSDDYRPFAEAMIDATDDRDSLERFLRASQPEDLARRILERLGAEAVARYAAGPDEAIARAAARATSDEAALLRLRAATPFESVRQAADDGLAALLEAWREAIWDAVEADDAQALEALSASPRWSGEELVSMRRNGGEGLAHAAAAHNSGVALRALGKAVPDLLAALDGKGRSPADIAAEGGGLASFNAVLELAPEVARRIGPDGRSCAHIAAERRGKEILKLIERAFPELLDMAGPSGETPRAIGERLAAEDASAAKAESERKSATRKPAAQRTGGSTPGIVFFGLDGRNPDMMEASVAIMMYAMKSGNTHLMMDAIPKVVAALPYVPSGDGPVVQAYQRIAASNGWKRITPTCQVIYNDGKEKFGIAFPSSRDLG